MSSDPPADDTDWRPAPLSVRLSLIVIAGGGGAARLLQYTLGIKPSLGWGIAAAALIIVTFTIVGRHWVKSARRKLRRHDVRQRFGAALYDKLIAGDDLPPFAFYVRPFFSDGRFAWSNTDMMSGAYASYGAQLNFEDVLALSVEPGMRLIALSGPANPMGPAKIAVDDASWRGVAEALIERARLIFVMPLAQPATMEEIEIIAAKSCLEKTVFVVPPIGGERRGRKIDGSFLQRPATGAEIYRQSNLLITERLGEPPVLGKWGGMFWLEADGWVIQPFRRRGDWTPDKVRSVLAVRSPLPVPGQASIDVPTDALTSPPSTTSVSPTT